MEVANDAKTCTEASENTASLKLLSQALLEPKYRTRLIKTARALFTGVRPGNPIGSPSPDSAEDLLQRACLHALKYRLRFNDLDHVVRARLTCVGASRTKPRPKARFCLCASRRLNTVGRTSSACWASATAGCRRRFRNRSSRRSHGSGNTSIGPSRRLKSSTACCEIRRWPSTPSSTSAIRPMPPRIPALLRRTPSYARNWPG